MKSQNRVYICLVNENKTEHYLDEGIKEKNTTIKFHFQSF